MPKISVKKTKMGRPIAKPLPIKLPQSLNFGYGLFKLRPDGSRDIRAECRELAMIVMKINGMSGQLGD